MSLLCHDVMWMLAFEDREGSLFLFYTIVPFSFSFLMCCYILPHISCLLFLSIHSLFLFPLYSRCDITTVLLCVEQLMWSVCESPEALVHSNPSSAIAIIAGGADWSYIIHSLCEQLLTVLVIVTAPLSLLCRLVYFACFSFLFFLRESCYCFMSFKYNEPFFFLP